MRFNIAIDGPASAGKSTLAKGVAKRLGFIYVDTGAMYRTIGLYLLQNSIDVANESAVKKSLADILINIEYIDNKQQILLNGDDVTNKIRTEEIGHAASVASAYKDVRAKLLDLQRDLAKKENVVMDGRDIGTKILPNADLKIFLVADAHVRAVRRQQELGEKNIHKTVEEVEKDLTNRDHRDASRENAPLKQAEDAILMDSTSMTIEEEIEKIVKLYESKIN